MKKSTLLFTLLLSIIFGIKAQQLEIIGNGEPTLSSIIPINGNWFEYQQKSQTIYPQAKLAPITNKLITKITFFSDVTDIENTNLAWQNNIHVSMANTTKSNLSAGWFTDPKTEVFVGKLNLSSSGKLTIELETPFKYTGNNLLIEFDLPVVESNTYKSANFIGTEENYMPSRQSQAYTYTEEGTAYNFLPKIVIDYAEGNVCLPATNVHASDWGSSIIVNWDAPAINKNKNVILSENFENGIPSDWTQIDADDDGNIWTQIETFEGYNGGLCVSSASYIDNVGPVYPDNYLITPLVKGATSISYRVSVQDIYYPHERYAVMVSSTGTNASDFTTVFEEKMVSKGSQAENERGARIQGTWYERNIELPAGIKYVAFRHYNSSDEYWLNLDDITIYGGGPEESFTYSLSRNGTEIATGLILTNYSDEGLDEGTYEYCVEVVYEDCTSEPACSAPVEIIAVGPIVIPPVTNLTAEVDGDVVTLNWDKPEDKYVEVILEAHNVWGDGTGFQLLLDADAVEYGQTIPTTGAIWHNCSAPADLYDVFEYKILQHAVPVCDTQSMVFNGAVSIVVPTGTYDYCVVNPTPNDRLWIVSGTNGRGDDIVFESGYTYRFLVEHNGFNDMVTIIVTENTTGKVVDIIKSENTTADENSRYGTVNHAPISTNDFIQKEHQQTSRFLYPLYSGYVIFKDGVFIAEIDDVNTLTYVDSGVESGTHNYCVYSVFYTAYQSEPVCIDVTVEGCASTTNVQATANGSDVNVTWDAPASTEEHTYTVTRNGVEIASGLTQTSYSDKNVADGTYDYCVKVVYATCTSEPACASQLVVGMNNEVGSSFKVYPNPAKDIINVEVSIANVVMYNSIGQAVRANLNDEQIDVSSLENGIYYLKITDTNGIRETEKVIIVK